MTYLLFVLANFLFGQADFRADTTAMAVVPFKQDTLHPELVWVEGGSLQLGCTDEQLPYCFEEEKPAHHVTVSGFYMARFEVTNAAFCRFLNDYRDSIILNYSAVDAYRSYPTRAYWYKHFGGYNFIAEDNEWAIQLPKKGESVFFKPYPGFEDYPVLMISFLAALKYAEWLSQVSGAYYRLPTEAEWEYAARGGRLSACHTNSCHIYAGSSNENEVAVCRMPQKVGSMQPNELGLYDMSGNVYEWVLDIYDKEYYKNLPAVSENPCRQYAGSPFIGYDIRLSKGEVQNIAIPSPDDPVVTLVPDLQGKELERVVKGGGHVVDPTSWRVSYRDFSISAKHTIGFRVIRL